MFQLFQEVTKLLNAKLTEVEVLALFWQAELNAEAWDAFLQVLAADIAADKFKTLATHFFRFLRLTSPANDFPPLKQR